MKNPVKLAIKKLADARKANRLAKERETRFKSIIKVANDFYNS